MPRTGPIGSGHAASGAFGLSSSLPLPPLPSSFPLPQVIVEIAFANNPNTPLASLIWTDVTRYVQTLRTTQGRQHELARIEAGRLTARLVNFDDRFNPFNTASPYYGPYTDGTDMGVLGLVPMKRIRVRAVYGSTTYPIWCGYVESWPMVWPSEKTSFVDVTATDGFKLLQARTFGTVYFEAVRADKPIAWFRLGDATGSTSVSSSIPGPVSGTGAYAGTVGSGVTLGAAAFMPFDPTTGATFNGTTSATIQVPFFAANATGLTSFSVEFWISTTATGFPGQTVVSQGINLPEAWNVRLDTTGKVVFSVFDDPRFGGGATGAVDSRAINDGARHHVVCTNNFGTQTANIYVDGVVGTPTVGSAFGGVVGPLMMGLSYSGQTFAGTLQDVAVYPSELSGARVLAHYNAGINALAGQLSGARVNTILDDIGWPTADRNIEAGNSTLQGTKFGQTALAELDAVQDSENGTFFFAGDGKATMFGRAHTTTNPFSNSSQVTLAEAAQPFELSGTTVLIDDLDLWNDIQIQRANGVTQLASDQTSIARYAQRTYVKSNLQLSNDNQCLDLANFLLSRYKAPVMRVGSVTVHPLDDPTHLFAQVLGRVILDRVTIGRATPGGGTAYNQQANIEYIEHTIDAVGDWHTVWRLAPIDANLYWILQDVTRGVLDSTTRLFW